MNANTTITSYDFLMRNMYAANHTAYQTYARTSISTGELLTIDSDALTRVCSNLKKLDYDEDNGQNLYNNVCALVDTYNNMIDSADSSDSAEVKRAEKKLTSFVKKHSDDLKEVGITISTTTNKMTLDKSKLNETSPSKLEKVFGADSEFTSGLSKYTKSLNRVAKNFLLSAPKKSTGTSTADTADEVLPTSLTQVTIDAAAAVIEKMSSTAVDFKA